jgi:hypothetical protein
VGLKTAMAADLDRIFLDETQFAESGTYTPQDGTGFTLVVFPGDSPATATIEDGGIAQEVRTTMTCVLATFLTLSASKYPLRGDLFVIGSGDMAGTWRVDTWTSDSGGGLTLGVVRSDRQTASANGTREV